MPSIGDAIDRMDSLLSRWEPERDYRAVFVRSYRAITARMKQAVENREFEDNDWMEQLDVQFAQEYFDALEAYESGEGTAPDCWNLAFDLAVDRRTTVLQDLLLGMNAHILHDLPIALVKMGLAPADRELRRRDHDKVNIVLGGMIDTVQRDLSKRYSLVLGLLDRLTGRGDEILTDNGIRLARADAWRSSLTLVEAPNGATRAALRADLDRNASATARLVGSSTSFLARLVPPFRRADRALAAFLRG